MGKVVVVSRVRVGLSTIVLLSGVLGFSAAPAEVLPRSPISAPLPIELRPQVAKAAYCASNPTFTGRVTASSSSTTAITSTTTGNVFGYISNVNTAWSCTLYRRYSALTWNDTTTTGTFNWGTIINSTSVPCNWAVGSTDYLKANNTADCADTDAEYAMSVALEKDSPGTKQQGVYHADINHNAAGDFSFAHADCDTTPYYGAEVVKFNASYSTGSGTNRPGANCDPITLDSTNTTQTFTYDSSPPSGSISIEAGATYATTPTVTLTLSATDNVAGVADMRFSNNGSAWSAWQAFATSRTGWDMTASAYGGTGSDGTKTVYVQYRDGLGNASGSFSDTIILDTVNPTGTIAVNGGATYTQSQSVTLNLTQTDNGSGPFQHRFSNDGTSYSTYEAVASTKAWTLTAGDGTKTVSYQVKDNAGRESGIASDSIILDTVNPTASVSINGGAATSTSATVILTVSAFDATSGVASTQASNDNVTFLTVTGASPTWTLSAGDGLKTVWYRVIDNAGRSTTVSDTITLATDWVPGPGPAVSVPYQAAGWKYQQVGQGGSAGFEVPAFDDSVWPSGQGAFASGGGCPVQNNGSVHTAWSVNTDMLVRRHIALAPGTTGVQVWVTIDNDIQEIWWNGTQIGGPSTHEFCPNLDNRAFSVSPALVIADNVLAIRARDRGSEAYFDARVITGGMPIEPALDGTISLENGGTTGDPVHTFNGVFVSTFTDISIDGRGPSPEFSRSYNSGDARVGPLGPGWTYAYYARLREPGDGSGDLLFVRADGNTDRFTRNNDETFSPSLATYARLVRNADLTYTITELDNRRWNFDSSGKLTAIIDRFGNSSVLSYDTNGRLISVGDPAGRGSLTLAYTGNRLTSVSDWLSPARTVTYGYDASGRLQTVTNRDGKTTTYGYDGQTQRVTSITDARGNVSLTLTYDAQGRVQTEKDARGLITGEATTFAYVVNPDASRVTTATLPPSSFEPSFSPTVADSYNALGWITQRVTRPTSTETYTETFTYDAIGNRASATDARGNRTDYCYDTSYSGGAISGSRGNLTRVIQPPPTIGANRPVTLTSYDAKNNPLQTVTPRGVPSGGTVTCSTNLSAINVAFATNYAYDASGAQLLSMTTRFTDPDTGLKTAITKYEYGDAANPGRITKVIEPRGNTGPSPDYAYATSYAYFATGAKAGMLQQVTDPLGNVSSFDYDPVGRRVSSVDAIGNAAGGVPADHRTDFVYDAEDRIRFLKQPAPTAGGAQLVREARYDEVGNAVVKIDPNGQVTTMVYDNRNKLSQVKESPNAWTDPAAPPSGVITTEYTYDAAGLLGRVTRAKGDASFERATDYSADGRGLVRTEKQYPAWPSTTGALVTSTAYDGNGNRTTIVNALGQSTTYAFDALDRLTLIDYSSAGTADVTYGYDADSNRATMVDGSGSTTYATDEMGRLTLVASPGSVSVGYRYDLDGNRTKLIYPDATSVTYTFDRSGRLDLLTDWASRAVDYAYFPDGALQTATNPNGTVTTYSYDNTRRVTSIVDTLGATTIAQHAYILNGTGTVTALTEGALTWTYTPDRMQRLTGVAGPDGTRAYAYDPVGNRTSKTSGATTVFTYDRSDRLTAAGAQAVTVNANGALTARGTDSFTYDQPSRLLTANVGGVLETSTYDGDGVRFSRQVASGPVIRYVSDVNRPLPVTISDGTRKYVWGVGLAYGVNGAAVEVYHKDRLGSVRAVTDGTGVVLATFRADEFGVPTSSTGSSTEPFRFTGEPLDQSGLIYLRARYYDPTLARFMTSDRWQGTLWTPCTLNRFSYVQNNPVTLSDPSGLHVPYPSGSCPVASLLGALGIIVLAPADILVAAANVLVAPSVVGEVAVLPADVGLIYANGYLISIAQKGANTPCDQIKLEHPENPFGG